MIRRTPLRRGAGRLRRTRLRRESPKHRKRRRTWQAHLETYFRVFGWLNQEGKQAAFCQVCGMPMTREQVRAPHHKVPRSKQGPDDPWNLLAAHDECHAWLHGGTMGLPTTPEGRHRFDTAQASPANLLNGEIVKFGEMEKAGLLKLMTGVEPTLRNATF